MDEIVEVDGSRCIKCGTNYLVLSDDTPSNRELVRAIRRITDENDPAIIANDEYTTLVRFADRVCDAGGMMAPPSYRILDLIVNDQPGGDHLIDGGCREWICEPHGGGYICFTV